MCFGSTAIIIFPLRFLSFFPLARFRFLLFLRVSPPLEFRLLPFTLPYIYGWMKVRRHSLRQPHPFFFFSSIILLWQEVRCSQWVYCWLWDRGIINARETTGRRAEWVSKIIQFTPLLSSRWVHDLRLTAPSFIQLNQPNISIHWILYLPAGRFYHTNNPPFVVILSIKE